MSGHPSGAPREGIPSANAPDYIPESRLRELQLTRLKEVVRRAYENVASFRRRLDRCGFRPQGVAGLDDIRNLPFTTKEDLRDSYPLGLLASPIGEVVRLHASSGTTGKPIVAAYTAEDVEVWTGAMARCLTACGIGRGDVVQNAYGYGLFTGGLGAHYGAEELGATVIPVSGGNTDRQIMIMKDFGVTAICCTPSYFIHLLERASELHVDVRELPLRVGVFGAEPWSESMRRHIESRSLIRAFDLYGLSEIVGPGVAVECRHHDGLHILEDHFYPEVVDLKTGEPLPQGAEGELVLTTLSKRAMPMIRYRTRDITVLIAEPCPCGRTLRRMHRVARRADDMFIIRGVNVYPSQVEAALLAVEGTLPHYSIVLTRSRGLDDMEVQVEVTPEVFSDRVGALEGLRGRLVYFLEQMLGLRVTVSLVESHALQRSEGKAKRVVDRRNLDS